MITLTQIQEKLAEVILQSGLTQSEIARKLGIKQSQNSCYVHGKKNAGFGYACKFMCNFGRRPCGYFMHNNANKRVKI